jgi:hypothetical protein
MVHDLKKGESAPESLEEVKQEALCRKTPEWTGVNRGNTALKVAV